MSEDDLWAKENHYRIRAAYYAAWGQSYMAEALLRVADKYGQYAEESSHSLPSTPGASTPAGESTPPSSPAGTNSEAQP